MNIINKLKLTKIIYKHTKLFIDCIRNRKKASVYQIWGEKKLQSGTQEQSIQSNKLNCGIKLLCIQNLYPTDGLAVSSFFINVCNIIFMISITWQSNERCQRKSYIWMCSSRVKLKQYLVYVVSFKK